MAESVMLSLRRLGTGAQNVLDVMRMRGAGIGASYGAPYDVPYEDRIYRLRHYQGRAREQGDTTAPAILFVPPLMVAAEIYDISPELSAIAKLVNEGIDVWEVDFGAPEHAEGGMSRTLDDHVRAVSDAIDRTRNAVGRNIHLAGYSQGGMFCYQAAAYRGCDGLASIVTFGSPVDIHRGLPGMQESAAGRLVGGLRRLIERPLEHIEGLPGVLTSTAFKLLSPRKELQQLAEFVRKLNDRQALEKHQESRRFLGGEGFVAWPGPALRKFIDDFVVHNRLMSGGFVIDGQTVTLADLTCPILYFVGERDDIARAPAVRALHKAAPRAEIHEVAVRAGHFGLVVGSRSLAVTWPTVVEWLRWRDGLGETPHRLQKLRPERPRGVDDPLEAGIDALQLDVEMFYDVLVEGLDTLGRRIGEASRDVVRWLEALRWQLPRLAQLRRLTPETRINPGRVLAEQAAAIPDETFFLWKGRAFTYADSDRRVDNVARGLIACGVERGQRVAVLMGRRPSYLSMVTALSRIGAVAVLLGEDMQRASLERAVELVEVDFVATDPENAQRARDGLGAPVLVLGGGGPNRELVDGVIDMEAIDPTKVTLPGWYRPNPGRASEGALIIFTADKNEEPRAARITNRRWAVSALGAAATCTLTPRDTVYCCLPLHHAAGVLVSVGGALVGGARLALATEFSPEVFWSEVRRNGATVVFYAGDMCRELTNAPVEPGENNNPVRLFAGSGMRVDVWRKIRERFGSAGVLEYCASTEGNAVLANASGEKVGSIGRPLPGSNEIAVARFDFEDDRLMRGADGFCVRCAPGEPGVLIARVDPSHPMAGFDGYTDESESGRRIQRDVFEPEDTWFVSGDLVRVDADGDYWLDDRVVDLVRTAVGPQSSRAIEDALYTEPAVARCAVYGVRPEGAEFEVPVAAVEPRHEGELTPSRANAAVATLDPAARPSVIRFVDQIPLTDGFRPLKRQLRRDGLGSDGEPGLRWDDPHGTYVPRDGRGASRVRSVG